VFNINYCCNNCILLLKQLTKEYPEILTPDIDNVGIIGITEEPSSHKYYLVFYHNIHIVLDKIIQTNKHVEYIPYTDFDKFKEIGSGGYATVYTARYNNEGETVVLKQFKSFDKMPELFISEVSNNVILIKVIFNLTAYLFYLIVQKSWQVL